MTISALGTGSGLPLNDLTEQLVAAEGAATTFRLDRDQSRAETLLSAFGLLKVGLSGFQSSLSGLGNLSTFQNRSATSSDEEKFTVTADSTAAPGVIAIEVVKKGDQHRASTSGLIDTDGDPAEDGDAVIGGGTLTITQGTDSFEVVIKPSQSTLNDIRDAINSATGNTGVAASVINTGSEAVLTLTATDVGTDNEFSVSVDDVDGDVTDGSGLSQLRFDPDMVLVGSKVSEDQAADDAEITLDGQTVTNTSSNVFDEAIDGVVVTALEVTEEEERITVTRDTENARSLVEGFVSSYNQLAATFRQLNSYNEDSGQASILFADPLVRSAEAQLRNLITTVVSENPEGVQTLSNVGVGFGDNGELVLDSVALANALDSDFEAVGVLFASDGRPEDLQHELLSGSFDASGTVVGDGSLTIKVGDSSFTVAISAGLGNNTVSGIRDAINNASNNKGVTASLVTINDGAGGTDVQLLLTSDTAGSNGRLTVTVDDDDGNDADASGLSALAQDNLTVAQETSRSTPTGIAVQIDAFIERFVQSDGVIEAREDGLNSELADIASQREQLERRLQALQDRLVAKFSALDALVAQLNQTSQFLQQQFANISKISEVKKN